MPPQGGWVHNKVTMNQITDDILKGASNTKTKVAKTTAQLPIFRDSSNLLFLLMKRMYHVPGKMAKTVDTAIHHADEISLAVAMANEMRGEDRCYYLGVAIANIHVLNNMLASFQIIGVATRGKKDDAKAGESQTSKAAIPCGFSKDEVKEMRKLLHRIMAQAIGWRDSVTRQGHATSNEKGGIA